MYRSKKEVLNSIKSRKIVKNGMEYTVFVAFLGSDPVTQEKKRVARSNLDELKSFITDFYKRLSTGGESSVMLTPYQATDARNAYDLLAQHGITLTLVDCVRAMVENRAHGVVKAESKTTVGEAIAKYLVSIAARSYQYQHSMKSQLGKWAVAFGSSRLLSEVTAPQVKQFLIDTYYDVDDQGTWVTYNDVLGNIKTFFRWCASTEQQIISNNPIDDMKRLEIGYRQPKYMKAIDTEKLFRGLENHKEDHPEWLADGILSFLCGMRQAEIGRVRDGIEAVNICLEDLFIRIIKCKGSSRGIRPRAFHIPDQALAWMRSFDFMKAVMIPNPHPRVGLLKVAKEMKISLPKNAGRHTFITMFEAVHHDSSKLSAIVGNTESVRSKSYNGVELEREGRAYFAIMPSAPSGTPQAPTVADAEASRSAYDSLEVPASAAS